MLPSPTKSVRFQNRVASAPLKGILKKPEVVIPVWVAFEISLAASNTDLGLIANLSHLLTKVGMMMCLPSMLSPSIAFVLTDDTCLGLGQVTRTRLQRKHLLPAINVIAMKGTFGLHLRKWMMPSHRRKRIGPYNKYYSAEGLIVPIFIQVSQCNWSRKRQSCRQRFFRRRCLFGGF